MDIVYEILVSLLLCLAIICLIVGLGFTFFPNKANQLSQKLNVYIHTNPLLFKLDRVHFLESFIYKRHLFFGALITVVSGFSFYQLFSLGNISARLPLIVTPVISDIIYTTLTQFFLVSLAVCVVVGLVIFIRPSLLKSIEYKLNNWVDTTQHYENLEQQRALDLQQPIKWPRVYGVIIIILSVAIIMQCLNIL
jgi:uncharacterized protein YjeT (DUF2065 family)